MELWQVIILGIVEGITEFLPVSSTGHLILVSKILGLPSTEFHKSFEIAIQLGAILSVVVLYWRTLLVEGRVLARVMAAFVPTAVLGAVFYNFVKGYLLHSELVVLISLFIGGIGLIVFEKFHREDTNSIAQLVKISYKQAIIIGCCQAVAMVPGVSRSLATILGGLALGLRRRVIVQFSFLLAIPTMLCATVYDLMKSSTQFTVLEFNYLVLGFLVSFVVALVVVKFFLHYIERHNFVAFGVYRILFCLLFLLAIGLRWIQ